MPTPHPSVCPSRLCALIARVAALAVGVGCSQPDDTIRFRYANAQPAEHPRSLSMVYFEDILEERTAGRIEVENHFGGTLGRERELMDMVALNVLQGTRGGFFFDLSPKYLIYLLPYLVDDWDQALRLMNSDFAAGINAEARRNGYYVPACGISQGFRAHTNSVRPLREPTDFRGLKLRVPAQEPNIVATALLGANPQEIPFTEVYQAARTGVIDGQDNAPSNIWETRVHEVQRYLTISNYMTGPDPFIVNARWYDSLPGDLQKEFDDAARDAIAYSDQMNRESEAVYIEKLSAVLETNWIEGEARERFRKALDPVYDALVAKGYFSWDEVEAARRAAKGE